MKDSSEWGGRAGFRARRGDMSTIILVLLLEKPMHGYEVISHLEQKSHGNWRPSPGAVYPNLQLLEDQGFATSTERDGKRVYTLTESGRKQAEENQESFNAPWDCNEASQKQFHELRLAAFEAMSVFRRIVSQQSDADAQRALKVMQEAKTQLDAIATRKD